MSSTSSSWRSGLAAGLRFASSSVSATKTLPSSCVPRRDAVAPPELARHAPGLDVLEPVEPGLLPGLGNDRDVARAHRLDRRLGERLCVDIPLVGQHRLDHQPRAVAERLHDHLVFDRDHQAFGVDVGHHRLASVVAVEAAIFLGHEVERVDLLRARLRSARDLDGTLRGFLVGRPVAAHVRGAVHQPVHRDAVALRDAIVVEIVRAGDLHRARSEIRGRDNRR